MMSAKKTGASPCQTMDIKTAFMASGSRKRKASTSEPCQVETKSIKLNSEDNKVEVLDEACGITVTVQPAKDAALGDCKENLDINSSQISNVDSKENIEPISIKDECIDFRDAVESDMINNSLLRPMSSSSPIKAKSEHSESEMCDTSVNLDTSACDDLNASVTSSNKEVSLNASGVTGDENDVKDAAASTAGDSAKTSRNAEAKTKKKKMTPAEAQKRAEEREQKQRERLMKKRDLENKKRERQLEKERKAKEKLVRKEREELERKEREKLKQEKILMKKEREEQIQQKKLEEQKKKEELKQKKEEELKKAEEEKLKKEQKEKERAEKAKAAFVKFFVRGDSSASTPVAQVKVPEKEGAFLPFQVLKDMTLASVVPLAAQERFDRNQLDKLFKSQECSDLYLQILKSGSYKDVRQRKRTKTLAASDADVIVIDENAKDNLGLTAKLLQFHENIRPPYWGTWRKKSKNICPRKPFGQDGIFDYDVDSDDEWDEGGPGESLSGTEAEDESEDDYEVDNEFFVPHGYLSDEEEKNEDDDEEVNNDPEKQKALLKKKLQEFETERKKKTTELKPLILGCYFAGDPKFQDPGIKLFLQKYSAEVLTDSPIPTRFTVKKLQDTPSGSPKSSLMNSAKSRRGGLVPEDAMPQLIRHIHGNMRNMKVLAEEFQKLWTEQQQDSSESKPKTPLDSANMEVDTTKNILETGNCENVATESASDSSLISVRQLKIRIKEIATYGKPPDQSINKCCWWVHENVREKYGLVNEPLPNQKGFVSFPSKAEEKPLPIPSVPQHSSN